MVPTRRGVDAAEEGGVFFANTATIGCLILLYFATSSTFCAVIELYILRLSGSFTSWHMGGSSLEDI